MATAFPTTDFSQNNAAPAFELADLQLIAAAHLPAGAVLTIEHCADYADEIASLLFETPCPVFGLTWRQAAAFYREGAGVRLDIGVGPQEGGRSLLVGTVAEALTLSLDLLPKA